MTRVNVFRISKGYSKFIILTGSAFAVAGIILTAKAIIKGFDVHFPKGDWFSLLYIVQGVLLIIIGAGNLLSKKYYIEWDENEIKFRLPRTKKTEIIKIADIVSVHISLFKIQLNLQEGIKIIDLNELQYEDIKRIKAKFWSVNRITQ